MSSQLGLDFDAPVLGRPKEPTHFFVQSHVTAEEKTAGERKAKSQEAAVLNLFRHLKPGERLTPSEVAAAFPWPVTSVRRAMTNLAAGETPKLRHWPGDRKRGPWGAMESTWSLAEAGR